MRGAEGLLNAEEEATVIRGLNALQTRVHEWAVDKGWWDHDAGPRSLGDQFANFHSELTEAWEEYRNGRAMDEVYMEGDKPCGIPIELADTIIRICDTCAAYHIDLAGAILRKMAYNQTRAHRHGGKLA